MMITQAEWQQLASLQIEDLKRKIFLILQRAAFEINQTEIDDPRVLEIVPRLADVIFERPELHSFIQPFSALARATGLWNYIDKDTADWPDALTAEIVTASELNGIVFHREQIAALNELFEGRNLILSAPTSFGKSLLIDALLASSRYSRVAIVLPTIALMDEFRRRIRRRFKDKFDLIMHPGDQPSDQPTIFLGTQERIINRNDLGALDLTIVDEFYKLDPGREDERSVVLNAAVYKLLRKSRQFFFLGPNIDNVRVSSSGRWKFHFHKTRFSTVAVDTIDLRSVPSKEERLYTEATNTANWPTLIFVSSPDRANRMALDTQAEISKGGVCADFAFWLRQSFGRNWLVPDAIEKGIGVHHGRLPRAVASYIVRLFNSLELPILYCTSTLIEGVNTAAKSVLIFDKKINRADYDFFTYNNIKGRAGRLGQHNVGRVVLFNQPPTVSETEVEPTLFTDSENAPIDYIVHLDVAADSDELDSRLADLMSELNLSQDQLRIASSIGIENSVRLKRVVDRSIGASGILAWRGYPDYDQIRALMNVICEVRAPRHFGVRSASQLTFYINSLRVSASFRDFFLRIDNGYQGERSEYDNVFKFLRACEYGLPQFCAVIQEFVNLEHEGADYALFVEQLGRWFRAEVLKDLDEEGVALPISERFFHDGDSREVVVSRLREACINPGSQLSPFERRWLRDVLDD